MGPSQRALEMPSTYRCPLHSTIRTPVVLMYTICARRTSQRDLENECAGREMRTAGLLRKSTPVSTIRRQSEERAYLGELERSGRMTAWQASGKASSVGAAASGGAVMKDAEAVVDEGEKKGEGRAEGSCSGRTGQRPRKRRLVHENAPRTRYYRRCTASPAGVRGLSRP